MGLSKKKKKNEDSIVEHLDLTNEQWNWGVGEWEMIDQSMDFGALCSDKPAPQTRAVLCRSDFP